MKFILVTEYFPPIWGGVSSQNVDEASFFAQRGHEVSVYVILYNDVPEKQLNIIKNSFADRGVNVKYIKVEPKSNKSIVLGVYKALHSLKNLISMNLRR